MAPGSCAGGPSNHAVEFLYAMRYLSVHDLLWVNRSVTGVVLSFDFETLEACIAAQYDYGSVRGLAADAASFLADLLKRRPIAYGNRRTALLATATFLAANGCLIRDAGADVGDLVLRCERGDAAGEDVVSALADTSAAAGEDPRSVQVIVSQARRTLAAALDALAHGDGPAST